MIKKKKLKICCEENIFASYSYGYFDGYFSKKANNLLWNRFHYYHITDKKTDDFVWSSILNFLLPEHFCDMDETECIKNCEKIIDILHMEFPDYFNKGTFRYMLLDEYSFGVENNRSKLITSMYQWQRNIDQASLERNMWEHFDMESEQILYSAVHFNVLSKIDWRDNRYCGFIFESHVDHPDGIPLIYKDKRMEYMRKHSEGFLDVGTRKLALGEILIY